MGDIFILTMVIFMGSSSNPNPVNSAVTTIVAEYYSKKSCEEAKELNRNALSRGTVLLATCTRK